MSTNHIILIVDDDPKLRKVLYDVLQAKGYVPMSVATGKAALDRVEDKVPTVALIDLRLGDMSGLELMGEIKECCPATECIVLAGYASQASAIEAINLGAYSYMQKPYDIEQLLVTIRRAIEKREAAEALRESEARYRAIVEDQTELICRFRPDGTLTFVNEAYHRYFGKRREELIGCSFMPLIPEDDQEFVEKQFTSLSPENPIATYEHRVVLPSGDMRWQQWSDRAIFDEQDRLVEYQSVGRDITERRWAERELQRSFEKLQRTFKGMVNAMVSAIEIRDPYTAGHGRRVTELACAIAERMGLSEDRIEGLRMAGLIHDIGKVGIPAEVLSKPGQLNELEWGMIKAHPQVGYDVLKTIEFPWPVAQIVLQHHERIDGSGYPTGLSGDDILLEARILAVADVVEAMVSNRPHRPPHGLDKALEEVSQNKGILYDPEAMDVCLKLIAEKVVTFE